MKTIFKIILVTVLSVALSTGFHYIFKLANGYDAQTTMEEEFNTQMTNCRSMFDEKLDSIQLLTSQIYKLTGLQIVRDANGNPVSDYSNVNLESLEGIYEVFSKFSGGGQIDNITVTNDGVYFFTEYTKAGITGFVYENVLGSATDYDTLEIVDEWKLFYQMNV